MGRFPTGLLRLLASGTNKLVPIKKIPCPDFQDDNYLETLWSALHWSPETQKQVAVGQGSIDWKKTFAAAKIGGIKNYFVEMNFDLMKASVPYLRRLQV